MRATVPKEIENALRQLLIRWRSGQRPNRFAVAHLRPAERDSVDYEPSIVSEAMLTYI